MFVERAYRLPKQVEQLELFGVRTRATTKRINLDKMDRNSLKAACPLETRECGHTRMWPSAQETRETEAKEQNKEREKERETVPGRSVVKLRVSGLRRTWTSFPRVTTSDYEWSFRCVRCQDLLKSGQHRFGLGRVIPARISQVSRVDCQTVV